MLNKPQRGLFVTGTDTGVGKTYVAALIIRELVAQGNRVGVYKPAASGCRSGADRIISDDADLLSDAAECPDDVQLVCPQRFLAPLAPHLAARWDGLEIDVPRLRSGIEAWTDRCDIVIVEGAGGLMSPISDEDFVADLVYDFGYPLVVVAPNVLGTINQTLQTLIAAATFRDGIDVAGIVLNDVQQPDPEDPSLLTNRPELQRHVVPPVLCHVAWAAGQLDERVDWFELADRASGKQANADLST